MRWIMYNILEAEKPMTVRQMFYRLVTLSQIAKTESEYKHTVIRLLGAMRLEGDIPFDWIADNTRWQRKPRSYDSVQAMLKETARLYRRNLWMNQCDYVEIWLEKEALAGVLFNVTALYDVPLMVTRGYASLSFLSGAAEAIAAQGKPAYIYYFGDHDPSGHDIMRNVERRLTEFAPDAEIHFQCVAVTSEQIEAMHLPTRPTKQSDSRAKHFRGGSVEVDAIPSQALRDLATASIERHLDERQLAVLETAEASERTWLRKLAKQGVPQSLRHTRLDS